VTTHRDDEEETDAVEQAVLHGVKEHGDDFVISVKKHASH
jgi:hypothetical protein